MDNEKKFNRYDYIKLEKTLSAKNGIFQSKLNTITDFNITQNNNIIVSHEGKLDLFDKNGMFVKRVEGKKDEYSAPLNASLIGTDDHRRYIIVQSNEKQFQILDSDGKFIAKVDLSKLLEIGISEKEVMNIHITTQKNILIILSSNRSSRDTICVLVDLSGKLLKYIKNVRIAKYIGKNLVIAEKEKVYTDINPWDSHFLSFSENREEEKVDTDINPCCLLDFTVQSDKNNSFDPLEIICESAFNYNGRLSNDGKCILVWNYDYHDNLNFYLYDLYGKKIVCENKNCSIHKRIRYDRAFSFDCHMQQFKSVYKQENFFYCDSYPNRFLRIYDHSGKIYNFGCDPYVVAHNNEFIIVGQNRLSKIIPPNMDKKEIFPPFYYEQPKFTMKTDDKDQIIIQFGNWIKILKPDGTIVKTFEKTDEEVDEEQELRDSRGRILKCHWGSSIDIYDQSENHVKSISEYGKYNETLSIADGFTIDKWDNIIAVSTYRLSIRIYDPLGNLIKYIRGAGIGGKNFEEIYNVTSDSRGRIIIAGRSDGENIIQIFARSAKKQKQNFSRPRKTEDPYNIIKVRYAKGEITYKEFEHMKKNLL